MGKLKTKTKEEMIPKRVCAAELLGKLQGVKTTLMFAIGGLVGALIASVGYPYLVIVPVAGALFFVVRHYRSVEMDLLHYGKKYKLYHYIPKRLLEREGLLDKLNRGELE